MVGGAEYPAVIKGEPFVSVKGVLFYPRNFVDVQRLDDFESESYYREVVQVIDCDDQVITANVYLWGDERESLLEKEWSFGEFETQWFPK